MPLNPARDADPIGRHRGRRAFLRLNQLSPQQPAHASLRRAFWTTPTSRDGLVADDDPLAAASAAS